MKTKTTPAAILTLTVSMGLLLCLAALPGCIKCFDCTGTVEKSTIYAVTGSDTTVAVAYGGEAVYGMKSGASTADTSWWIDDSVQVTTEICNRGRTPAVGPNSPCQPK